MLSCPRCFCQQQRPCPVEAKWSCPDITDSTSIMAVDYTIGAKKTSSPLTDENKNLTYITRNDKKLSYVVTEN